MINKGLGSNTEKLKGSDKQTWDFSSSLVTWKGPNKVCFFLCFPTKWVLWKEKNKPLKQIVSLSHKPTGTHFSIFIYSMFLIQNPAQKDCCGIKYHHINLDQNKACLHACLHQTPLRVVPSYRTACAIWLWLCWGGESTFTLIHPFICLPNIGVLKGTLYWKHFNI